MHRHTHGCLALRLSLCATAFALGAALARYSNVARHDLTRSLDVIAAQHLRASVRYTGRPSAAARTSRLLRAQ
jgi:hypothetical protein